MKKLGLVLVAGLVLGGLSGCAHSMRQPVTGLIYSDVKSAASPTDNPSGNRMGEACATSVLGLFAFGDATLEAARRNGGITSISSVDESFKNVFVFWQKYCVVVRGR